MKHGEILKLYSDHKNINVTRMGRDLEVNRTALYSLFKSEKFKEKTYLKVMEVYPDFEEFTQSLQRNNFNTIKSTYESKGYNKMLPPTNTPAQTDSLIMASSSVAYASLEMICRAVAILEDRPLDEVRKEANQLTHDKMSTFEILLKEMISLP